MSMAMVHNLNLNREEQERNQERFGLLAEPLDVEEAAQQEEDQQVVRRALFTNIKPDAKKERLKHLFSERINKVFPLDTTSQPGSDIELARPSLAAMSGYISMNDLQLAPLRKTPRFNDRKWRVVSGVLAMDLPGKTGKKISVTDLAFSANRVHLVVAKSTGTLTVYDTRTGEPAFSPLAVPETIPSACAISAGGTLVAAGCTNGHVLLWDCSGSEAKLVLNNERAHSYRVVHREQIAVSKIAISADGSLLASTGHDGRVRVWRIRDNGAEDVVNKQMNSLNGSVSRVNGLQHLHFSSDNRRLVACGGGGVVWVVDVEKGTVSTLEGLQGTVLCCCFSKSSAYVAASDLNGCAAIWALDQARLLPGGEQKKIFTVTTEPIPSCAFDPNEDRESGRPNKLLLGTGKGEMVMYNMVDGKFGNQLGAVDARGFGAGGVRHVKFSIDGSLILAAGTGNQCLVFTASSMALLYKLISPHPSAGHTAASFSPDMTKVAVGLDSAGKGQALVWDIMQGAPSTLLNNKSTKKDAESAPFAMFVHGSRDVVHSALDGTLTVWGAEHDKDSYGLQDVDDGISAVCGSPCGKWVAAAPREGLVKVWDACSGGLPLAKLQIPWPGRHQQLALSENGHWLLSYCPGAKHATLCSVRTDSNPGQIPWSGKGILSAKFAGGQLVLCGDRPYLETWAPGDPGQPKQLKVAHPDEDLQFVDCDSTLSHHGVMFVATTSNGQVYLWHNASECAELLGCALGHAPTDCKFSPDGRMVLTYGSDGRLLVWTIGRSPGDPPRKPRVLGASKGGTTFANGVADASWSADGKMIVSCGEGAVAHLERCIVFCAKTGLRLAVLFGEPGSNFMRCSFSTDGELVCATREDGKVVVYTRAAAQGMMTTDFGFWYTDTYFGVKLRTDEVETALKDFPQAANHIAARSGHNLITAAVEIGDPDTLEVVLNLMDEDSPVYSFQGVTTGQNRRDALLMAIEKKSDAMVYDLLMAVAEGKVTHSSASSVMEAWPDLCQNFSNVVLVFLSKLKLETVADGFKYVDCTGLLEADQDNMVVTGSTEYSLHDVNDFWTQTLDRFAGKGWLCGMFGGSEVEAQEAAIPLECNSKRVGLPFAALADNEGLLKPLLDNNCQSEVFGTEVVKAVIQWKWQRFAKKAFMLECFYHLLQLLSFTTFAILLTYEEPFSCDQPNPPALEERFKPTIAKVALAFEVFSLLIALRNLAKECLQMVALGSIWKYFTSDFWNVLDFISYTIIIFVLPINLFLTQQATCLQGNYVIPGLNELVAIEVIFLWVEVVHFAQGFRETGALVRIIERTIADISWFMVLQAVLMVGFGTAFTVLFTGQTCDPILAELMEGATCNEAYDDIGVSIVSMVGLVLGDIAALDFYVGMSPRPFWTTLLMIIYEFLVFVVLFNMLIALMSETFAEVKASEEVEFLRVRADIICGMEQIMRKSTKANRDVFPKYLHVLELKEDEEFTEALELIKGNQDGHVLKEIRDTFQIEFHALKGEIEDLRLGVRKMNRLKACSSTEDKPTNSLTK